MFCQKCGTKNPDIGKFCRNCGTDLTGASERQGIQIKPSDFYIDRKGRVRSNNPDDLWSSGIKNTVSGIGFLIVSLALLLTNVAGGHNWWWAMLFPAFSLLANGLGNIAKSKRLEKKQLANVEQPQLSAHSSENAALPSPQTEFVKQQGSIYDTGELVAPPSVAEGTTRHLEMNAEGQTMTLPKNETADKWKN